ncbi:xanthine dehydrogenase family protein molybdopterin-binding subunit, partial [Kosakonia cowanii]|nr:xanthine dehydrogenase family protein molybdopterin-binding subunit [Kosakonia cowanii]
YGYVPGAGIAKDGITAMDINRAKAAPGVLAVVPAGNAGKLDRGAFYGARALAGPNVDHHHQVVAMVVAETFEQAPAAAGL